MDHWNIFKNLRLKRYFLYVIRKERQFVLPLGVVGPSHINILEKIPHQNCGGNNSHSKWRNKDAFYSSAHIYL